MVEPFFDRSKAIYREGLYRSLEIFSNHVNNSGGCTHNPAEHSPTTTSLPPPPAMRRYLPLPLSFPRMTEEFGSGDRRWQPAAANSARCLRAFRRRTATNPRRPIDSTADKNIGAAFHAQSVPPLPPPPHSSTLHGSVAKERWPVLSRFHFFSLSLFPFVRIPLFLSSPLFSSPPLPRSLAEVGSRRLNLILNHSAAFTRYRDVTREREGQRNGNFDVGSIATWINCFLATDRVDRSMKLIERIPSAANFFLEPR